MKALIKASVVVGLCARCVYGAAPAHAHGFKNCTKIAKASWKPASEAEAAAKGRWLRSAQVQGRRLLLRGLWREGRQAVRAVLQPRRSEPQAHQGEVARASRLPDFAETTSSSDCAGAFRRAEHWWLCGIVPLRLVALGAGGVRADRLVHRQHLRHGARDRRLYRARVARVPHRVGHSPARAIRGFQSLIRPLRTLLAPSRADRAGADCAATSVTIRREPRCRSRCWRLLAVSTISGWMQITETLLRCRLGREVHTWFFQPGVHPRGRACARCSVDVRAAEGELWCAPCSQEKSVQRMSGGLFRRLLQKLHQRLAILGRADGLLRHLGAGRVGHRADLEQLGHRLRRPDDVELLQRRREIVAGQRRDPAAENAVQASGRRDCLRRASACGRRRRRGTPARRGRRHRPPADRRRRPSPPGRCDRRSPRPSGGSCGRCRR